MGITAKRPTRLCFVVFLLGGCVLLPTGGVPTVGLAGASAPPGPGLFEYRVAFHVHGSLSHDSEGSVAEIARAAHAAGLDAVLMTDHYAPGNVAKAPRGVYDGVLVVPGVELRGNGGSILGVGLREDFAKRATPSERLALFEEQGAVGVLGHVERIRDWDLEPFHGFEVYNLHAEFQRASKLGIAARALFTAPDSFFECGISTPERNLRLWDRELARGRHLAPLAGHDAHANIQVLGATVGSYAQLFRLFSTRVLARELSGEAIREALRRGRTLVAFDFLADAAGFRLSYGRSGAPLGARAIVGDTTAFEPEDSLEVELPRGAPAGAVIHVLRDGETLHREPGPRLATLLPGPGIYRVEVFLGERLWILPGPIWIE